MAKLTPLAGALASVTFLCAPTPAPTGAPASRGEHELDVHDWRVIDRESGPVSYYSVVERSDFSYIHSAYRPGLATTVLGYALDGADRRAHRLRWSWRANVLPRDGGCNPGLADAAANVYVSWKRGLRWYTVKYVWATGGAKGARCQHQRNPFVAQDTIILQAGPPVGAWIDEEIDLDAAFRSTFEDGNPSADVPELQGVAILTDGDETQTEASADFARFVIAR